MGEKEWMKKNKLSSLKVANVTSVLSFPYGKYPSFASLTSQQSCGVFATFQDGSPFITRWDRCRATGY